MIKDRPDSPLACLDLAEARELARRGVPVFVAKLKPNGDPVPPKGWQQTEPDPAAVDRWRPGLALCAVTGVIYDVLDIDPRNGSDESMKLLKEELGDSMPYVYGIVLTPSGGEHYWIAPLGIGTHTDFRPGLDLKGGRPDGESRGFVFLPPTARPAKGGEHDGQRRRYVWS